jgi:hypothetical protein
LKRSTSAHEKSNVRGATICEPNGDSGDDFLRGLLDDARAKGLDEVEIKEIDQSDWARVKQVCKDRGLKASFED